MAALVGKTPENTAEWTGSAYVEYRPPILEGLAIGGGAFYVSSRPVNALNEAFVDGYTTYSASLRYNLDRVAEGMSAQLNADNLTNERYWAGTGSNVVGYGAPRLVKLTVRVGL